MAPAVAKILKNGHGIHLPAGPSSAPLDSDVGLTSELAGGGHFQEVFRNLPSSPFPLCIAADLVLPHQRQAFCLGLVPSARRSSRGSQRGTPVFSPGGADPSEPPAGSFQETGPPIGGRDASGSPPPLPLPLPPPSSYRGVSRCLTLEGDAGAEESLSAPPPPRPPGTKPIAAEQEAAGTRLRRQAALQDRAHGLRARLQALLGQHALDHCHQQLEGLRGRSRPETGALPHLAEPELGLGSTRQLPRRELVEFSRCSRAVLRGLQEVLDSDATASSSSSGGSSDSSSSDEERVAVKKTDGRKRVAQRRSRRPWLEQRAALASRWSWLQLRLAELDGRIQQVAELHRHVRSNKVGLVLAESQPLTDTQIQRTLLGEVAGLSCSALDADSEPCSPTRLLHNIERQSAQLNQIVNSLMFSAPSKEFTTAEDKTSRCSAPRAHDVFVPGALKRKRRVTTGHGGSLACARTRPLVSHCRRRLFVFSSPGPGGQQDSGVSMWTSSSTSSSFTSSSSSCPCSSPCRPVCADPDCSSRGNRSCGFSSRSSPPPPDPSRPQPPRGRAARENWCLGQALLSAEVFSPTGLLPLSSTPQHHSRRSCKQRDRRRNSRIVGLSPIRTPGFSSMGQSRRASLRKRKRRRPRRSTEDEDLLPQLWDTGSGSDDMLGLQQVTQALGRRCSGESLFNISNVVIPSSGAKVEKLQYKDIVTPRWRAVDTSLLLHSQSEAADEEGEPEEDVSDEAFARRHWVSERSEKMQRWSWRTRPCCRHPRRSGSRWSGSGGGTGPSGEKSVEPSPSRAVRSETWPAEAPWKQRVFPLAEEDEDALLCDDPHQVLPGPFGFGSVTPVKPNLSSACTILPSSGQSREREAESSGGSASV